MTENKGAPNRSTRKDKICGRYELIRAGWAMQSNNFRRHKAKIHRFFTKMTNLITCGTLKKQNAGPNIERL